MRKSSIGLGVLSVLILISCGGGSGPGSNPPPSQRITVDITETSASVQVGQTFQFHCTVTNTTNTAVTWKVDDMPGGNNTVGTISAAGLYTGPVSVPSPNQVAVKAVSQQDITCSDTATVTITGGPAAPNVQPASATVPAGNTQQFTADMPVTWSVMGVSGTDPGTWGTISSGGLYTAPLFPPWQGKVSIVATSTSNPTLSTAVTATIVFSKASLQGRYALRYRGFDPTGSLYAVGSLAADGNGVITAGTIDFINPGSPPVNVFCTGTYSINPDGRGSASLTLQTGGGPQIFPLHFVMTSSASARVIGFDDTGSGWGNLDKQDPTTFASGLAGTYVFQLDGLDSGGEPIAISGIFNAGGGTITSGTEDINDNGTVSQGVSFTGSYTAIDSSTGRGTATLNAGGTMTHFSLFLLNPGIFLFASKDSDVGYIGTAIQQDTGPFSNSSFSGDLVFFSTGYLLSPAAPATAAGYFSADGGGNLVNGVVDNNLNGTVGSNLPASGTYSMSPDGHGTATLTMGGSSLTLSGYLLTGNDLFFVSTLTNDASTGQFLPASLPVSTSMIRGSWSLTLRGSFVAAGTDLAGQMTLDGSGNLNGNADVNASGTLTQNVAFSGTYSVSANGRGEATLTLGGTTAHYALHLASGRWMALVPIDNGAAPAIGFGARLF